MNDLSQEAYPALVIAGGSRNGESLLIDTPGLEKMLGSGPDCHLRFTGSSVDHHHAGVLWDESAGLAITDQGSATGTWVNGERVSSPRVLQDGDRISLGPPGSAESVKLLVQIPPQFEAPLVLDADEESPVLTSSDSLDLGAPPGEDDVFDASAQEELTLPPDPPAPTVIPVRPAPAPPPAVPQTPAVIFRDEDAAPAPPSAPRRPVFTDQLPSIVVDRPREAVALPPPMGRPRAARAPSRSMMPVIGALVALVVLGGGAYAAKRFLFREKPVLTGVAPSRAEPGQALVISGTGFAKSAEGNTVLFGPQKGTVSAVSESQLTATVPTGLDAAAREVTVAVETSAGRSNVLTVPLRIAPRLTALEPDVALPGADLVIKGQNLDGKDLVVTIGTARAEVREARAGFLRVEVPRMEGMIEGQGVVVGVQAGGEASRPLTLTLGHLPLLTKVEPLRGEAGDRAVIRGRGFDTDAAANLVTFGGERALVVAATDQQLEVVVPAVPAPFNVFKAPIVVEARGAVSSGPFEFTVLRPSSGTFVPRFFPAAVSGAPRQVFISSEAGPFLLLTSADGAGSVPERAVQVANALNALFRTDAAPATIEVRSGDPPAVAVAGAAQPLVRATPEDAGGYAQPWNTAMKGQRVGSGTLAAHWAALLNDYLTLFMRHERPTHVVEVSPRGKVMLELHAEGERRLGRGGGVPAGLLMPPGPVLSASLRELALAVPTRAQSVPGAALVGRWVGRMEETLGGPRTFQLRLRLEGTELAGSVSTTSGKIVMDVPLKAVKYEKGVLSFEVGGGVLRRFRGTVSGSSVTGAVSDGANKQVGNFTLQYVD